MSMRAVLTLCITRPVMQRAGVPALIVGAILVLINHGPAIREGTVDSGRLLQMLLTVLVPYVVSTVSSVITILDMQKEQLTKTSD
jgi:hypothetical protein